MLNYVDLIVYQCGKSNIHQEDQVHCQSNSYVHIDLSIDVLVLTLLWRSFVHMCLFEKNILCWCSIKPPTDQHKYLTSVFQLYHFVVPVLVVVDDDWWWLWILNTMKSSIWIFEVCFWYKHQTLWHPDTDTLGHPWGLVAWSLKITVSPDCCCPAWWMIWRTVHKITTHSTTRIVNHRSGGSMVVILQYSNLWGWLWSVCCWCRCNNSSTHIESLSLYLQRFLWICWSMNPLRTHNTIIGFYYVSPSS